MAHITRHAAERYVERIAPHLTLAEAETAMLRSARVIDLAAAFGARTVKLSGGARLCLRGNVVTTVKDGMSTSASGTMLKRWKRDLRVQC